MSERAPSRVVFVDLLRLLATFQMVQGHTIDGVLAPELRSGAAYDAWSWVRGLTAVAFLFAAGLSFQLATLTRLEAHRASDAGARKRLRRAAMLIGLGYLLHAPIGALFGDATAWDQAAIVDVLQCIGVTLLVLEWLASFTRLGARTIAWIAAALALFAWAIAPSLAGVEPVGPAAPLLHYVTREGGSLFPIAPWSAYFFGGVAIGMVACPDGARTPRRVTARRLFAIGGLLLAAAALARGWDAPSALGLVRLGAISAIAGLLVIASLSVARLPRRLEVLAGETLVIYVGHLVVVYGAGIGLSRVIGPTLGPALAGALALVMVGASALLGLAWSRWRGRPAPGPPLAGGVGTR